jgi:hypothetical protein
VLQAVKRPEVEPQFDAAVFVGVDLLAGRAGDEGRRTWFETIDEMQVALDDDLVVYNTTRPHQGRGMNGRTPVTVFKAGLPKPKPQKKAKTTLHKTASTLAA